MPRCGRGRIRRAWACAEGRSYVSKNRLLFNELSRERGIDHVVELGHHLALGPAIAVVPRHHGAVAVESSKCAGLVQARADGPQRPSIGLTIFARGLEKCAGETV